MIIAFLLRLLNRRLDRRANRAVTNNLAEGADRAEFRSGVQVRSTMVADLADPGVFVMVVKDFSSVEMNLTREQHAHNQGMHPNLLPIFLPASHVKDIALSCLDLICLFSPTYFIYYQITCLMGRPLYALCI